MRDLRRRCEWDAAQSHASLRPYLLEEAHELDDALRAEDDPQIREELGDVLLQVLFHSVVAEERGAFDLYDVADGLIAKMKRRHPHLYGDGVREPWEKMKARRRRSIEEGLPADLPALHRSHRLQDRAAGVGFDWPDVEGPALKVEEELGDLLFAVVNLCRKAGVHASLALDRANEKFVRRFTLVEQRAAARGIEMADAGIEVLDEIWEDVKREEG